MQADYSPIVDAVRSGFGDLLPLLIFVLVVAVVFKLLERSLGH